MAGMVVTVMVMYMLWLCPMDASVRLTSSLYMFMLRTICERREAASMSDRDGVLRHFFNVADFQPSTASENA